MHISKLILLQCLVHNNQMTIPEIQSFLQSRQYTIPESSIYRLLPQMQEEHFIQSRVIHRLPVTKNYSITSQGRQEYQHILQVLNLTDSHLTSQTRLITQTNEGESVDDLPISVQVAQDISDILRDIFLDNSPSDLELQRIQAGTKQVIKYLQRTLN